MWAVYGLFYTVAFLNIIIGVCRKQNVFCYMTAFVIIFMIMTFNYDGADVKSYISTYDNLFDTSGQIVESHMEKGYLLLMYICRKLGMSFFSFRIVVSIISLSLFANILRYFKVNRNLILGFYMIYLFYFDVIQIRNCIAQFIILFSIRFLLDATRRYSIIKFLIGIFIAASFHSIALFYLPLLVIKFIKNEAFFKFVFIASLLLFLAACTFHSYVPIIANWLLSFIKRGSSYLDADVNLGHLVVFCIYAFTGISLNIVRKKSVKGSPTRRQLDGIVKIHIILSLYLSLLLLDSNFYRIVRNVLILSMIGIALHYKSKQSNQSKSVMAFSMLLLINLAWIVRDLILKNTLDAVKMLFEYNLVFNMPFAISLNECVTMLLGCAIILFIIFSRENFLYKRITKSDHFNHCGVT